MIEQHPTSTSLVSLLAFIAVGCQGGASAPLAARSPAPARPPAPAATARLIPAPSVATPKATAGLLANAGVIAGWVARRPALRAGLYGSTDTSAYDSVRLDRLSAEPQITGAVDRRFTDTYSFLRLAGSEQLVSASRVIVRGRPVAFSRPYFNSYDGSYWDASSVGPAAGRDVASEILRDILFEVDEVIGDASDAEALLGLIEFTVRGGQALVTITDTRAAEGDHPLPPGTYVVSYEPDVDLAIGEEVILFLDYVALDGLYAGEGERFGYVYRLMPAHDLYYKWTVTGGTARNERFGASESLTLADLRALVASEHFASAVGPPPDDRVHEQGPLHSTEGRKPAAELTRRDGEHASGRWR